MSWRPILTGSDAMVAEDHIEGIAKGLMGLERHGGGSFFQFPYALAELGLFFHYASLKTGSRKYQMFSEECMDRAIMRLNEKRLNAGLHGGVCGIALAMENLAQSSGSSDPTRGEDPNAEVDELLLELLQTSPWPYDYDLIKGLAGFGAYFSMRLHRPTAREGLEMVVKRLAETHTDQEGDVTWHTPHHLVPPNQRQWAPEGYFNVGVAHGVPGVMVILAIAIANGIQEDAARQLLVGLVRWMRRIRQDAGSVGSHYPSWWMPSFPPTRARQAWCYGDPGVAAAWLWTGILVEERDWKAEAVSMLRFCATSPPDMAAVEDAALCHGAVGLGHLYNRVYQATDDEVFRHAAIMWLRRGFGYRGLDGEWGYQAYRIDGGEMETLVQKNPWGYLHGFLTGSAGIGLGYLAATSDVLPEWDRFLLLSLPPRDDQDGSKRKIRGGSAKHFASP